jgi:hypothetical protein
LRARDPHTRILDQRGISLIEVVAGTLISVLAMVGLAYSFGVGRGLINRYEIARAALSTAQERLEVLSSLPPGSADLAIPAGNPSSSSPPSPFYSRGRQVGEQWWVVEWVDDPIDGVDPADPYPEDLKRVTAYVTWQGDVRDTVRFSRYFYGR